MAGPVPSWAPSLKVLRPTEGAEQGRGRGRLLLSAAALLPAPCTGGETAAPILLLPAQPSIFIAFTSGRAFSRTA